VISQNFHKPCHQCSAFTPNVTFNFSEVKVKVQGQNCRAENRPLLIAWRLAVAQDIFTMSGNTIFVVLSARNMFLTKFKMAI